ncbi:PHD finger domain-containing protein [Bradyrhizobium sp. USDA 4451]
MQLLQAWAAARGLSAGETAYVDRTPQRRPLRFSRSGHPAVEASYRTHWVWSELSETKRARLEQKASRAPELVVIQPLNEEWRCHRCGGTGDLLMMENPGPACPRCVGLDDLEFLPAGDAKLTRRVKASSARYASSCASAERAAVTNDRACWSSRAPSRMIRKSAKRFSEKIMLKQRAEQERSDIRGTVRPRMSRELMRAA